MTRRPESSRNGKSELNGKGSYPIIETRRVRPPRVYSHRQPSLLPLVLLCLTVGLATALLVHNTKPTEDSQAVPESEAFRWAVNRAMTAAELTQTAQSVEEWQTIASWWQEAIKYMQTISTSDANHRLAVDKIAEYQNNLRYAQNRSKSVTLSGTAANLWGIGSQRAMVIKVQGQPSQSDRYDSMCKEVLHYGKSKVELNQGTVVRFEDFDHKFKAADTSLPPLQDEFSWNLGSLKESVFKIQGTPSRVLKYDYSDRETLYYGSSTIDLAKQQVIGYDNEDGNLKVHITPILVNKNSPTDFWTLESDRENLLQVQGTPNQVQIDPSACTETFYYGSSTVTLKNGFIAGYDNFSNNLKVKTK